MPIQPALALCSFIAGHWRFSIASEWQEVPKKIFIRPLSPGYQNVGNWWATQCGKWCEIILKPAAITLRCVAGSGGVRLNVMLHCHRYATLQLSTVVKLLQWLLFCIRAVFLSVSIQLWSLFGEEACLFFAFAAHIGISLVCPNVHSSGLPSLQTLRLRPEVWRYLIVVCLGEWATSFISRCALCHSFFSGAFSAADCTFQASGGLCQHPQRIQNQSNVNIS